MSRIFNLLLLNSFEDIHPRTWICIFGPKVKENLRNLEKDVCKEKRWNRNKLSTIVGKRLNCSKNVISQMLYGKRKFYPLPIILQLIKLSKNKKCFLKNFKHNIQFLKVNSASARPIKAFCNLNENTAKIIGAFMADGSLSIQKVIAASRQEDLNPIKKELFEKKIHYSAGNSISRNQYYLSIQLNKNNLQRLNQLFRSRNFLSQTHYNIELTDEYKDNVKSFIGWVKKEFRISPTALRKKKNAWCATFSNKILARYLMTFFDIKPGPKTYDAFEPRVIKNSTLKNRKAFAKGVLMFDGCISINTKILFSSKSKILAEAIREIWNRDKIHYGISFNFNRQETNLFTTAENKKEKLQEYFEKNTQKWKLLKWYSGDPKQNPVIKRNSCADSVSKVLGIVRKAEGCDALFVQQSLKCSHTMARNYLKILRNQEKIRLSNQPARITQCISSQARIFLKAKAHNFLFFKLKKEYGTYKNFSEMLNIKKATFSTWHVKKNGIPLYLFKTMCQILNIDSGKLCKNNIEKLDREVAEII